MLIAIEEHWTTTELNAALAAQSGAALDPSLRFNTMGDHAERLTDLNARRLATMDELVDGPDCLGGHYHGPFVGLYHHRLVATRVSGRSKEPDAFRDRFVTPDSSQLVRGNLSPFGHGVQGWRAASTSSAWT
jgi:hypothetical protein